MTSLPQLSKLDAAIELQSRRWVRRDFRAFVDRFNTEAPPAKHHVYLINKLQQVAEGEVKRLMVFMPAGAAKSHYANVQFSAFMVGAKPNIKLITASYSGEVAEKWGRRVRSLIREDDYRLVFNTELKQDSQAVGRWQLENGSEYYAVGVGGSVTSFRADLAIIDDPVKGREEADSETIRKKTIDWWKSDLWTRLKPDAAVVVIMTRWHEEDLAGWLLEEQKNGGEKWEVVSIPMLAEAGDVLGRKVGERLWADWFTPEMVEIAKRDARNWNAMYQQNPTPEDGSFFKREWFKRYRVGDEPRQLTTYGAGDYAVSEGKGDYTEQGICGFDINEDLYLLDWWSGQASADVWIDEQIRMAKRYNPMVWVAEAGVIRRSLEPFILKAQQHKQTYYRTSSQNKAANARAFQALCSQGKVYIPYTAWGDELLAQLLQFPAGKYDDKVDVCGLFGRILDQTFAPRAISKEENKKRDAYSSYDDENFSEWKTL
ncbi:MAG: hypothetical protein CV087_08750 [Candidatus Brocadia sp. WS118]|nr:MAG: hypothetical protein CV087_08750 [Candidatus Brocadia sp. WS118]